MRALRYSTKSEPLRRKRVRRAALTFALIAPAVSRTAFPSAMLDLEFEIPCGYGAAIERLCLPSYCLLPSFCVTPTGPPASDILRIAFQKPGAVLLLQPG